MTLARWQATIQDDDGNVVPAAQITVRREISGAPLAVLYSDRDGNAPIGNPFNADVDGFAAFHAAGGSYRIDAVSGDITRTWRYVGIGTSNEFDATDIVAIVQNVDAGYALRFEIEVSAPPSEGAIRFNNADLSLATEAYISSMNAGGSDIESLIVDLFDASRTRKDGFVLSNPDTNEQSAFVVDGVTPEGSPTEYLTISISGHSGESSFSEGVLSFQRERAGADGADGDVPASRTLTAGAGLTGGGDLSADRSFAVGAGTGVVVNTDDVAVDKASNANVMAAASNKVLTSDLIESASAQVTLTDAATVALNWDAFITAQLEIAGNRTLGNPTNVQPGTFRTVQIEGDGAAARTLSFDTQYRGVNGAITGIDDGIGERALITLYALPTVVIVCGVVRW